MRSDFAGATDYDNQSLLDISTDLSQMADNFCRWGAEMTQEIRDLQASGYWDTVPSDLQQQIGSCLKLFDTACGELTEISALVGTEVHDSFPRRLRSLANSGFERNREIGKVWHADYMRRFKDPQYGSDPFMALEKVYGDARDSAVTLLDLGAMGDRLDDFVGRIAAPSRSERLAKWVRDHAGQLLFAVVAAVVVAAVLGFLGLE